MAAKSQTYAEQGVALSKSTIYPGNEVTLTYSGLLVQHGASIIYAHIGYGGDWVDKDFIPMQNTDGSYTCTLKVLHPGSLNLCFKDSAENWDNNSQANYSFKVTKKAVRSAKTAAKRDEPEAKAETKVRAKAKASAKTETKKTSAKPKSVKKSKEE